MYKDTSQIIAALRPGTGVEVVMTDNGYEKGYEVVGKAFVAGSDIGIKEELAKAIGHDIVVNTLKPEE